MCVVFIEIFLATRTLSDVQAIGRCASQAAGVMTSRELDDDAKEKAARESALTMLRHTSLFIGKFALACAALAVIYFLSLKLDSVTAEAFAEALVSLPVLLGLMVFSVLYVKLRHAGHR